MSQAHIFLVDAIRQIQRGGGVVTTPLATPFTAPEAKFTTGMSVYPVGKGAPLHVHNCDEQVTLLEGVGEVEIEGQVTALKPYDSTYIPGNKTHAFRNTGDVPMRILWVYASTRVTRTFDGSTEEVEHLSAKDMMVQD